MEDEVVQIEMLGPSNKFASWINGMLVYETRFTSAVPSANLLYDIHVLHCMHGAPGFPQLIGIVVDKTGKTLKSYLTKLPNYVDIEHQFWDVKISHGSAARNGPTRSSMESASFTRKVSQLAD